MKRLLALGFAVAVGVGTAHADGDIAHGKLLFQQRCQACHSTDEGVNRVGPTLFGIFGRRIGTVPNFYYSDAIRTLQGAHDSWDEQALDAWLASPRQMAPGTKMAFAGVANAEDRADLIAFLKASAP